TVELHTGQKNAGPLGDQYRSVGFFKGLIKLCDEKKVDKGDVMRELLAPKELFVRYADHLLFSYSMLRSLYILRGLKLCPADRDGFADPYLVITCGKTKITTRDRYHKTTLNPDFFERSCSFLSFALIVAVCAGS